MRIFQKNILVNETRRAQPSNELKFGPHCHFRDIMLPLKHTTTLFLLPDHYILSREWRVIVDRVQSDPNGKPMVL